MHAPSASLRQPVAARLLSPRLLDLYVALAMVALYVWLRGQPIRRTTVMDPAVVNWAIAACALAIASPRAGLVMLLAIGPFRDANVPTDFIRAKTVLSTAVLIGVGVRIALNSVRRWRARATPRVALAAEAGLTAGSSVAGSSLAGSSVATPPDVGASVDGAPPPARSRVAEVLWQLSDPMLTLALGALIVAGTGLSLAVVSMNLGEPFASQSATAWGGGIWTPFAALFAAAWLARQGDRTALVAALVAACVAGVIGLIDHLYTEPFTGTLLGWTIQQGVPGERRLGGVLGLPNPAATMLLGPAVLFGAAAIGLRDRRLRVIAAVAAVAVAAVIVLTYSRSAFLAVIAAAVVVAWRRDRRLGLSLVVAGILAMAILVPQFVAQRGDPQGNRGGGGGAQAGLVTGGDDDRIAAWTVAVRMWLDAPIAGHGFQTYKLLHAEYGEPVISAPHNEWLRLFAEEGIFVGLAGVGFVLLGMLALARERGWIAAGILGMFVGYVIMASFNNPVTYGQVGLTVLPLVGVGLGMALASRAAPARVPVTLDDALSSPVSVSLSERRARPRAG